MHFFTIIWRGLGRRRMRTALTIGAMALAVSTFVALVSMSTGFERQFNDIYAKANVDLLIVTDDNDKMMSKISEADVDKIEKLPGIDHLTPSLMDMISVDKYDLFSLGIQGFRPEGDWKNFFKVIDGRSFTADDHQKILIGEDLQQRTGLKVGDTLTLYDVIDYQVIGIYQTRNGMTDGMVVMPLKELQQRMQREGVVTGLTVKLVNPEDQATIKRIGSEVKALNPTLSVVTTKEYIRTVPQIVAVKALALITSTIALVIGAIGVLNTMFMSVFERTKEIGVLRAIGWGRLRIIRMIVGESLLMSIGGAIVGTIMAFLLTTIISHMPQVNGLVETSLAWPIILQGAAMAIGVALVAAAIPAIHGARLHPTVALRHE